MHSERMGAGSQKSGLLAHLAHSTYEQPRVWHFREWAWSQADSSLDLEFLAQGLSLYRLTILRPAFPQCKWGKNANLILV